MLRRTFSSAAAARSYIGRKPLDIPKEVQVIPQFRVGAVPVSVLKASPDRHVTVKGPKGQLELDLLPFVRLTQGSKDISTTVSAAQINVSVLDPSVKNQRAGWGLTRALLNNAVVGVSEGFDVHIKLVGVGYRATLETKPDKSQALILKLGFSHNIYLPLPAGVTAQVPAHTQIVLSGIDKQLVFQYAAKIRSYRKPEPYNGKGIFVGDETVRRKEIRKK